MQVEYAEKIEQLNLEVRKIEAKWTQLFRLPLAIVALPIKLVMALAIPISVITKQELPEAFWSFLK